MSEARLSRRRLITGGLALAGGAGVAGGLVVAGRDGGAAELELVPLPAAAPGLPAAQHFWDARLARDAHGNVVAPRHQVLLLFDLAAEPTLAARTHVEAAMRRIDALDPPVHALLAWGPRWFTRIGVPAPVPAAMALSDTEAPTLDGAVACLHLAADDAARLAAVEAALTRGAALPGGAPGEADLRRVLRLVERRGGFVGAGLPAEHVSELTSRDGVKVAAGSPLFMGFPSGMRRNQASEPAVTIDAGRWRGGTTMHVSRIALTLPSWYASLDDDQRAARMHAPGVSARAALAPGDGIDPPTDIEATARRHGVIGHAQAAAVARRRGRPVILRRDFNGVEDGQPMVHFVALARTIEDFIATREAMNAARAAQANPSVGAQINNGINEWLSVHDRANYLVPPRAVRAFPGLPGTPEAV